MAFSFVALSRSQREMLFLLRKNALVDENMTHYDNFP